MESLYSTGSEWGASIHKMEGLVQDAFVQPFWGAENIEKSIMRSF